MTVTRLLVLTADTGPGGTARWLQHAIPDLAQRYALACVFRTTPPYLEGAGAGAKHPPVTYAPLLSPLRLFGAPQVLRALRAFRPDVILVSGYVSLFPLWILRTLRRHPFVPILIVQRGVYRDFPNIAPWKNKLGLFVASRTLTHRDRLAAVSPNVAEYLCATSLRRFKVQVIANGIAEHRVTPRAARAQGPLQLVFVGRLSIEKGADRLPAVVDALPEGAVIHIAGTGAMEAELRQQLAPAIAAGRAVFHGWVDEPVELLRRADALLILSRTEGCPHAVLEAFGTRTLVLSLRVGGMPYVLDDGRAGLLFDSIEDLLPAVSALRHDRLDTHSLLLDHAATLLAERYSHDAMMRTYRVALESLRA